MNTCLSITVEISPGTAIEDACPQLCALASTLMISVHAKFNDVTLLVKPGGDPAWLEGNWRRVVQSKATYKIATCRPWGDNHG